MADTDNTVGAPTIADTVPEVESTPTLPDLTNHGAELPNFGPGIITSGKEQIVDFYIYAVVEKIPGIAQGLATIKVDRDNFEQIS